jgi:hypothetical protein
VNTPGAIADVLSAIGTFFKRPENAEGQKVNFKESRTKKESLKQRVKSIGENMHFSEKMKPNLDIGALTPVNINGKQVQISQTN